MAARLLRCGLCVGVVLLCSACGRLGFELIAQSSADGSAVGRASGFDGGRRPDAGDVGREAGTGQDGGVFDSGGLDGGLRPDAATDAGIDAGGAFDAGVDAGLPGCATGRVVFPVAAANASPWAPTQVCAPDNALVEDGAVTGLDRFGSTTAECSTLWAPSEPCACVAVDFGEPLPIDFITLRVGATGNACGKACEGGFCNTGQTAGVSYGLDPATYYDNPNFVSLTDGTLREYRVDANATLRWVIVCRIAFGDARDDIVVDAVTATCL